MAENLLIARPYAKAIFEVASKNDQLKYWAEILQQLAKLLEHENIVAFLNDPRLDWQTRSQIFIDACQKDLDKTGVNFLKALAFNKRLILLPEIAKLFFVMQAAKEHIVTAKLFSARELEEKQRRKLEEILQKRLQNKVELMTKIDANLIGGIKIYIGDHVIDLSARGKLEELRRFLLA